MRWANGDLAAIEIATCMGIEDALTISRTNSLVVVPVAATIRSVHSEQLSYPDVESIFLMTTRSSMQALTLTAPPHVGQLSMSILPKGT